VKLNLDQSVICSQLSELNPDCVLESELELELDSTWPPIQVSLSVLLFGHMGVGFPSKCPVASVQLSKKTNRRDKRRTEKGDILP